MRLISVIACLFLLAACNLSDEPPVTLAPTRTPITAENIATEPGDQRPTALPGVMTPNPNPNVLPTRTPIGSLLPTPVNNPLAPTVPTSETGESAVVNSPAHGSTVFTGTLQISGVVSGLARDEFTLAIVASNGQSINTQRITLNNPNRVRDVPWSAAMQINSYTGPAEIRIIGQNPDGEDILLARIGVTFERGGGGASGSAGSVTRTEGATAGITSPSNGAVVPAGSIQVSGTAGGIEDNEFTLVLARQDGSAVTSQTVTFSTTSPSVVVPWSAALSTGGYTGDAEIRVVAAGSGGQQTTLASIRVRIQ